MRVKLLALVLTLCVVSPALARVGKSYRSFRVSEFARFFNITKTTQKDLGEGYTRLGHEPGKFRKHVDITIVTDSAMKISSARLLVSRSWLGTPEKLNPFAKDLVKSFIAAMICDEDFSEAKSLVDQIWHLEGASDEVVRSKEAAAEAKAALAGGLLPGSRVFLGREDWAQLTKDTCVVTLENVDKDGARWLSVSVARIEAK